MAEEKKEVVKTVRILFTDTTKDIPVVLYDGGLKENVELNPDAVVSEEFANALVDSYDCYKIIGKSEKVDKTKYNIRPDYKVVELKNSFDQLTPEEREQVVDFAQTLIDRRAKGQETQVASEVKGEDGKTDNSTKNKGDN